MATFNASVSFEDISWAYPFGQYGNYGPAPYIAGFPSSDYFNDSSGNLNYGNYFGPIDFSGYSAFYSLSRTVGLTAAYQQILTDDTLLFVVENPSDDFRQVRGPLYIELGYSSAPNDNTDISQLSQNLSSFGNGTYVFDEFTVRTYTGDIILQISDFSLTVNFDDAEIFVPLNDLNYSEIFSGNDTVTLSNLDDTFLGYAGDDVIRPNGGNDDIYGGAGNDTIYLHDDEDPGILFYGSDTIRGGDGYDIAIYEDLSENVYVTRQSANIAVTIGRATDYFTDIEEIRIGNTVIDTSTLVLEEQVLVDPTSPVTTPAYTIPDEVLQIARIYQAAFDRTPDLSGMNYWIDQWEAGMAVSTIAGQFMQSPEFVSLYGSEDSISNEQFIDLLYRNVLDREPDAQGYAYWNNAFETIGLSRKSALASFARSDENVANTQYLNTMTENADGFWTF